MHFVKRTQEVGSKMQISFGTQWSAEWCSCK